MFGGKTSEDIFRNEDMCWTTLKLVESEDNF